MVDPVLPTTLKGMATRRRILDAAAAEFAQVGIAGARMDRITTAAAANKAQVYAYFSNKEGLFDAVIADRVGTSTDSVPFDVQNLPGWVVRLYDQNLHNPELARLIAWTRLERRPTGRWFDSPEHESKITAISEAQAAGDLRDGDAVDLLVLLIGMASAWSPSSSVYAASREEPDSSHDRRRELLRQAVNFLVPPKGVSDKRLGGALGVLDQFRGFR